MANESGFPVRTIVIGVLVVIALLAFLVLNPIVTVGTGKRGVVTEWGKVTDKILGEGIHMVMPIVQDVEKMDVTILAGKVQTEAASKDLQVVHTTVTINYHLDPLKVNRIYQQYRKEIDSRVIGPAIRENLKAATAMYTAEELITKREMVKQKFMLSLKENLAKADIILQDVFITDFAFSPEFNKQIELKVQAQQEALTEKNNLEKIQFQAQQIVATAKANAEAVRITTQAINSTGGKDYVQLEAIKKWDGKLPEQMIPGGTVPFLELNRTKN